MYLIETEVFFFLNKEGGERFFISLESWNGRGLFLLSTIYILLTDVFHINKEMDVFWHVFMLMENYEC